MPTVTFLLADVENSFALWIANHPRMGADLAPYDRVLRDAVEANHGHVFKPVGDARYAAFDHPEQALRAALEAQRALFAQEWGVLKDNRPRVRMALHTGAARERGGDYSGSSVNRVECLLSVSHGGQILLSGATRDAVGEHLGSVDEQAWLVDLGEQRPEDLRLPEHIFQLSVLDLFREFPPLRTQETPGDRYRIIPVRDRDGEGILLGSGGMAKVFLARDKNLDRDVALKVMPHVDTNDEEEEKEFREFVERFRREAEFAAALSHPNIVSIHDRGETRDGTHYIVMEYAPRGTLKDLITRESPLPHRTAAWIALQIAWALEVAHEHEVIHRDVKPDNVLLIGSRDAIKVADFGIARAAFATELTRTNFFIGSAPYMSPEQVKEPRKVVRPSDLYSLGVVLYKLLTGELPFDGETMEEKLNKILHEPVRPPREVNQDVPEWLNDLCVKLLEKNPNDRHQNAAALIDDLELAGRVRVPDLTGQKLGQARSDLTVAGLTLGGQEKIRSETVPRGEIISQRPEESTIVEPGSPVSVTVSGGTGPTPVQTVRVPDLIGQRLARSRILFGGRSMPPRVLAEADLSLGSRRRVSSGTVPEGEIIGQDPAVGIVVPRGSVVSVTVSSGPDDGLPWWVAVVTFVVVLFIVIALGVVFLLP